MSKFEVGDRVVVNKRTPFSELYGRCGVVVGFRGYDFYGVEFDECIRKQLGYGHTCRGVAKPGHGWYLLSSCLDPIPLDSVSLPDVTKLL